MQRVFDCCSGQHFPYIFSPLKTSGYGLLRDWATTVLQLVQLLKCGINLKQHRIFCFYLALKPSSSQYLTGLELFCNPSGIVASDTYCCSFGPGFESRRRHGCLQMHSAFAAWATLNSHQAANPFMRLVEGEERWEALTTPRVLSQNWGRIEPNCIVTHMVLTAMADRHKSSPLPQ
ncbi:hypothetical protein TNCV_2284471 [Trichonephila clavipes]|nr:hypothetical protein TNCV_2284471 [Trichonephila clavipes]